jgi:hypothetical protein
MKWNVKVHYYFEIFILKDKIKWYPMPFISIPYNCVPLIPLPIWVAMRWNELLT